VPEGEAREVTLISVVVPVYRNRETVAELWRRIVLVLEARGMAGEGLFVIDGCPDDSGAALDPLAAVDSRLRVIRHASRRGQRAAWWTGLRGAKGDWIVVMDADLQDPPEAIGALLEARVPGVGAIYAGRCGEYESPGRLRTGRWFRSLMTRLAGIPRDAGGFLMLSRACRDQLLGQPFRLPYVPALPGFTSYRTLSVPVERAPRGHGRSTQGGSRRLRLALGALLQVLALRVGCFRIHPIAKDPP
jgi:polyisoprenyl-phosphate glycosyltransferase